MNIYIYIYIYARDTFFSAGQSNRCGNGAPWVHVGHVTSVEGSARSRRLARFRFIVEAFVYLGQPGARLCPRQRVRRRRLVPHSIVRFDLHLPSLRDSCTPITIKQRAGRQGVGIQVKVNSTNATPSETTIPAPAFLLWGTSNSAHTPVWIFIFFFCSDVLGKKKGLTAFGQGITKVPGYAW